MEPGHLLTTLKRTKQTKDGVLLPGISVPFFFLSVYKRIRLSVCDLIFDDKNEDKWWSPPSLIFGHICRGLKI